MTSSWGDFVRVYLRIGVLGFGGPQAHIAMLRDEIVDSRGWVDPGRFDEGLGLCEALPGPASSQMAIYLGWIQRGWRGGLISGICFLLPGLLIVLGLSEIWRHGQTIPSFTSALQTLQPVIAAVIWAFAWKLMRTRRNRWQLVTAGLVMAGVLLNMAGVLPLQAGPLLVLAGLAQLLIRPSDSPPAITTDAASPELPCSQAKQGPGHSGLMAPLLLATAPLSFSPFDLIVQLFSLFFKTGLLVFGGGLVIIPLLEAQVLKLGWLSSSQFLDGVAIGQISPGPVVLTSAFVGYQAGWQHGGHALALVCATVATAGIFLPSFAFILVASPVLQHLRQQQRVQRFLSGLLAGVPGAVAAAAVPLTTAAMQNGRVWMQPLLFVIALWLSVIGKAKPLQLIGAAIVVGLVAEWLG